MGDLTPNFSVSEFKCHDGTPYPSDWVSSRLSLLAQTLEVIREASGGGIRVISAYRPLAYNRGIDSTDGSQHVQGRAADIKCTVLDAHKLHALVLQLYQEGRLPHLGGLGHYNSFVHVDVRPNSGRLARWDGKGLQAVAESGDMNQYKLALDLSFAEGYGEDMADFDPGATESDIIEGLLIATGIAVVAFLVF